MGNLGNGLKNSLSLVGGKYDEKANDFKSHGLEAGPLFKVESQIYGTFCRRKRLKVMGNTSG